MKVELFIILVAFLIFFIWSIWYRVSTRRLLKKYEEINDGRQKNSTKIERGGESTGKAEFIAPGPSKPPKRSILEATSANSYGKNSKSTRNFFRRLRKRKK